MKLSDISVPQVYKEESADFRFFLKWFTDSLSKIQYDTENLPDICNDFYIEFMEPKNFFGLNQNELIEVIQHYCFWLYSNKYTQAHLFLLQN